MWPNQAIKESGQCGNRGDLPGFPPPHPYILTNEVEGKDFQENFIVPVKPGWSRNGQFLLLSFARKTDGRSLQEKGGDL